MVDLSLSIDKLKHIGPRTLPRLKHLGIQTVRDLLWHFPIRYEDYTESSSIAEVEPGEKVHIEGQVIKISARRIFPRLRRGFGGQARWLTIIEAVIKDDTGAIRAVWFNQPYILNTLPEGTFVSLAGKVALTKQGLQISSPTFEKLKGEFYGNSNLTHTHGLVPVYPETEGISSKYLRFLTKPIVDQIDVYDPLPESIRQKYYFLALNEAIKAIHFPDTLQKAEKAKERLAFDDLLIFQIKALLERRKLNQFKAVKLPFDANLVKDFISHLPFELTKDQRAAAWEILKDLEKSYPMNRLLEGDVGSGKTVVALLAALTAAHYGYQAVFMAPTEVLAFQHFETIKKLTDHTPISICLLTSSAAFDREGSVQKTNLKKQIAKGEIKIIIGTHAVIQKDVSFDKLALVVIDEQHRFGVNQRAALLKNKESETLIHDSRFMIPHLLSMTATPIPRSLALTIYGDLDISIIKEKPKNRRKIITQVITPSKRQEAYQMVHDQVHQGRQVFVICPRIETNNKQQTTNDSGKQKYKSPKQLKMDSLWAEVKAVEEEYKKLSKEIFPDLRVAMLHGKMPAQTTVRSGGKPSKTEIMSSFKKHEYDILVSTSVIEVGVDVPNAALMMIENAERFGLAQLHQFRGRIGRAEHQSFCLLFSSTGEKRINQRLKALVDIDDGFLLAEKDLAIRGPGEFFGAKQSGLPDLAMASLANIELIKKARAEARLLLKDDPNLKNYPLLKQRLEEFQRLIHFE